MPSQLVTDVRALIHAREDEGRPLTMAERALLLATLAPPRRGGEDAVGELEAAILAARWTLAEDHAAFRVPALKRLLAAARGVLEHTWPDPDYDPTAAAPALAHGGRPTRADLDG